MMSNNASLALSRRAALKGAGMLVVSIGMPAALDTALSIGSAAAQGGKPPLVPGELDSYIAVNADGSVSAFFGKMDMGQGLYTAIGQIVAEELDVPFRRVTVLMGDTATSVNQGGASGSTGIWRGGVQLRAAAAEARRVLVEMAAAHFNVPVERLAVTDGIVRVIPDARASSAVNAAGDNAKFISYAELIGGRYFNVKLEWNGQTGNLLYAPGKAKPKSPDQYRIVGKSIPRFDVAPKVYCQEDFVTDVKGPACCTAA
jgi:nicotinate dehydrogenase subunit B